MCVPAFWSAPAAPAALAARLAKAARLVTTEDTDPHARVPMFASSSVAGQP